jgi:hypothetical protein
MLVHLLILVLTALLLYHLYRITIGYTIREGAATYAPYDEQSCLALATQNQNNIDALKDSIDNINSIGTQVATLQTSIDNNTSTLQGMLDQTPGASVTPPDTDDDTDDDS